MEKLSKCRIEWIDIVKGIGILLMVIGHAGVSSQIKVWIYGFHMPLFFISAGYLYSMSDDERYGKLGFGYMLRHKAKAYLIPYIVLFFVNLFIQTMLELLKNQGGGIQSAQLSVICWRERILMIQQCQTVRLYGF